jgi:catechol 2,3-dioxygenase-like lactoylglutathione lyase family enzyme
MKRKIPLSILLAAVLSGCSSTANRNAAPEAPTAKPVTTPTTTGAAPVRLGNFSVSLAVKDIAASRAFYEKLGFKVVAGNQAQRWLVLQNDNARIGLFQGMFEKNSLTFNPGWDGNKNTLADFDDVREIQRRLKAEGLTLVSQADESTTGPAFIALTDPDGNPILIDQHVPSPGR